jgi:hypothetical protein
MRHSQEVQIGPGRAWRTLTRERSIPEQSNRLEIAGMGAEVPAGLCDSIAE